LREEAEHEIQDPIRSWHVVPPFCTLTDKDLGSSIPSTLHDQNHGNSDSDTEILIKLFGKYSKFAPEEFTHITDVCVLHGDVSDLDSNSLPQLWSEEYQPYFLFTSFVTEIPSDIESVYKHTAFNTDMAPADNQLSFEGKVSFILGGIALMIAASSILEYMLKRSEGVDDYDQYADIEELEFSSPEWCNLSTITSLHPELVSSRVIFSGMS
jgi:hypothetical protein